ncbi:MAG: hypothetical protein WKG03_11870 [Telluria sp.]
MTTHSVPVLSKGQYRIVAVTIDDDDNRDQTIGYAVLDSAGIRLRQELTLDDAKAWMERYIDEDNPAPSVVPVVHAPAKPRRVRR